MAPSRIQKSRLQDRRVNDVIQADPGKGEECPQERRSKTIEGNHPVERRDPRLTVQTLTNRVEALRLHNGEELQRWAARPLLAALSFAD